MPEKRTQVCATAALLKGVGQRKKVRRMICLAYDARGAVAKQAGGAAVYIETPARKSVRVPSVQRPSGHAFYHCMYWHYPRTQLQKLRLQIIALQHMHRQCFLTILRK